MERDLSSLVTKVYRDETRNQDAKLNDFVARASERCDAMAASIGKIHGMSSRLASVDQFTMELQKRIYELEETVMTLTAQVKAFEKGRNSNDYH